MGDDEDRKKRTPARKESGVQRAARYLETVSEMAGVAMSLRDRPTPMDWIAAALRVTSLAVKHVSAHRQRQPPNPWAYFQDHTAPRPWTRAPHDFQPLIAAFATDPRVADGWLDADDKQAIAVHAELGGEEIGWISEGGGIADGPYVRKDREAETYATLGRILWGEIGGDHLFYGRAGIVVDRHLDARIVATSQMTTQLERMRRFLDAGEHRSYLFDGPPGTGKSLMIRWLVRELGLRSVRIDLGVVAMMAGDHPGASATQNLEAVLRIMRPQAIILDDLDRIEVSAPLLAFLELARVDCDVVIASSNSTTPLRGAAIRPGRFDEVRRVDQLDRSVLRALLNDEGLVDRLAALPAAYVAEFVKRRDVLGLQVAIDELPELEGRAAQNAAR